LPTLGECEARPTVFVGTSAGAINAALFASLADLSAKEAADEAVRVWRQIQKHDVYRPVLQTGAPNVFRFGLGRLNLPGRLTSLLDTTPLLSTFKRLLDWQQLHENTQNGVIDGLAVVATTCGTSRTKIFVEGRRGGDLVSLTDPDRALDYVRCAVGPERHPGGLPAGASRDELVSRRRRAAQRADQAGHRSSGGEGRRHRYPPRQVRTGSADRCAGADATD
jgi:NTE family protein